jgi:hypothetical protein
MGLELCPGRIDDVAGRLREHREPEPRRRGPARTAYDRASEARHRRHQHREVGDQAERGVVGRPGADQLEDTTNRMFPTRTTVATLPSVRDFDAAAESPRLLTTL